MLKRVNMERAHRERINQEIAESAARVVVLGWDATSRETEEAVSALADGEVLFIHGAEDARFDAVKSRLTDRGHMGACGGDGHHLWWGARSGWQGVHGRTGDLPTIISYFTTGTPYEAEAEALVATCVALGLEHRVVGVSPRGAWEKNCAMKAGFVRETWRELGRAVLWVDADARVRRAPELLRGASADFGVHKASRWQFASGTVFVNATARGGELLEAWTRRCEAEPLVWDQVHLDRAWEEVSSRTSLETMWMPQAYTRIFDRPEDADGGGPIVVEHFQASRRLKAGVSDGIERPYVDVGEAMKAARRASRPLVA